MNGVDLVPRQGRRYLGAGTGSRRPRAEHRLVWCVLVVVDEDAAAALLLPPRSGDQVGTAPLELAGGGDCRGTNLVGVPPRLEADVDVEAPVPRGLRVTDDPELAEQASELVRRRPDVVEVDLRLRVEVEAELVDDVRAVAKVRPDMKAEAREVYGPDRVGHVGEHERARRRPVRRADDRRLQPVGRIGGDALLKERAPSRTVRK